LIEFNLDFLE